MASADYEETYIDCNARRNVGQRSYEEINAYENEERTIGGRGPTSTPAMPPPQLSRNPPQQDAERSHEMKNYGMKWLAAAFVIVSVIFVGMFAAVFVMITTGRDQGGSHKLQNETEYLGQDFQSRMTQLENQLLQNQIESEYLRHDFQSRMTQLENKLMSIADQSNDRLDWIMDHIGPWYKASNGLWYKIFNKGTNYTDAENDCQRIGARLASTGIRSPTVRSEIWTNVMLSKRHTWIGLNQPYIASGNDSWIWMDGAASNRLNTPWYSGEPNNYKGSSEDCAHITWLASGRIQLNDDTCEKNYAYICEKEF